MEPKDVSLFKKYFLKHNFLKMMQEGKRLNVDVKRDHDFYDIIDIFKDMKIDHL